MNLFERIKQFLLPRQDNNYKPHVLQKTAVVGMMGLVFLSFAVANLQSLLWITSEWMVSTILPAVIVSDTNEERVEESLVPLMRSDLLDTAAQLKAEDMAENEYFSHDSPNGATPWYWFGEVGYNYLHAGENLAVHFTDSSAVVEAWMLSPTHRANIMNGNYQEIGIGTAEGEYEGFPTVYVVQLFGTRQAVAATPAPQPQLAIAEEVTSVPTSTDVDAIESESGTTAFAPATVDEETTEPVLAAALPTTTTPALAVAGEETRNEVTVATTSIAPEEVVEVDVEDNGVVVYSSYMSTSTIGVPASMEIAGGDSGSTPPTLAFVTQPQVVLQSLYVVLGFFVTIALVLSIVVEIRRQEPIQIAYGMALIAVMILLFDFHISLTSGILFT